MNFLNKGLDKASKVLEENEESPNSDKENSVGSSVKQFYGTKRRPLPFDEVSATSLNLSLDSTKKKSSIFDSPPYSSSKSHVNLPSHKIGLPNAGLTCYLNACMQALLNCSSFNAMLLDCASILDPSPSPTNDNGKLFEAFVKIAQFKDSGRQDRVRAQLYELRSCLKSALPQITVGLMQDAHEFLVFFCDIMKTHVKERNIENIKCPFDQTFQYQLTERRKCVRCQYETENVKGDFVLRLDVPIPSLGGTSVSIQELVRKTLLGQGVDMQCVKCSEFTSHEFPQFFNFLPKVLIVYLPRSFFVREDNSSLKNRIRIDVNKVISLDDQVTQAVDTSKLVKTTYKENVTELALPTTPARLDKPASPATPDTLPLDSPPALLASPSRKRKVLQTIFSSSPESTPEKKSKKFIMPVPITEIKDLNGLSEEDQIELALQNSLKETKRDIGAEEDRLLHKALEESMKGIEETLVSNEEGAKETNFDIKNADAVAIGDFDYQLTGTICHVSQDRTNSTEIGHYFADVFNEHHKTWFRYNDEKVWSKTCSEVLKRSTSDGCLFFYTHRNVLNND